MSAKEKIRLRAELFELCQKIFSNISFDEFCQYITDSDARRTYVMLYRNTLGVLVGFFALHLFNTKIDGKKRIIFRAQTGLLQEYRRSAVNMYFSFAVILKYRIYYPFTPMDCFLVVISPSMYSVIAKSFKIIVPYYNIEPSKKILQKIDLITQFFGFKKEAESSHWTTQVGWVSNSSQEELKYWSECKNKHIKFFLRVNPNFQKGFGLITLIPFSWKNIVLSSTHVMGYIFRKAIMYIKSH